MSKLVGHCHCGTIQFEVETELDCPIRCNCSFCQRRGAIVQIVSSPNFRLLSGGDSLTEYGSRHFARHQFCNNCGIHTFTFITEDDGNKVAVNLACIDDVDLESLAPMQFDGKNKF